MIKSVKKKTLIILALIVVLAAFLRFYNLGINPPSLTWDEVAWGYNAYSLGLSGKDEFGKFLPITYLESFGDFKPPVYAYLDIIPIKIFGLNEFATRFPSAFFGTLTVLMTYFLVKRIFRKSENSEALALISAFVLAISPWHILLSRAAFEANVSTFFIVTGIWAFLAAVQDKKWLLLVSAVSFALSIYTFNTARVFGPLILLVLTIAFREEIFKIKTQTILAAILGLIIILPAIPFLLSSQAGLRFAEVNIFTDNSVIKNSNQEIKNSDNSALAKIVDNRRVGYGLLFMQHYFDNLSPNFLFMTGDGNPKFSSRTTGQMYLFEIPLLIAGILFLFKKKEDNWWLIPVWIILGIIPAATARETPHALRIETTLPTFQILVAYGAFYLYKSVSSIRYRVFSLKFGNLLTILYLLFSFFWFVYFIHYYFVQYPYQFSSEWEYGYKDVINYISENKDKYDGIVFTETLGRPYIYALFYEKYDPEKFAKTSKVDREALGFVHVRGFDKYKFVEDVKQNIDPVKNNLYIDTPSEVPEGVKIIKIFKNLDGSPTLVAYTK